MRKDILDPGPAVRGPEKDVGPGGVKGEFDRGLFVKWVGSDEAENSALPQDTLDLIARLDDGGVAGLLLPAVQKVAAAENMPFTYFKITIQESIDALELIADSFDDNVVFLDPGGDQGVASMFLKIGSIKGVELDQQDVGAWSPLSDFSDSDILL